MTQAAAQWGAKDTANQAFARLCASLLEAALVILLAALAARALWASYPPALGASASGRFDAAVTSSQASIVVQARNPFRRGDPALADAAATVEGEAPASTLNLSVVGLRSSKSETGGAAIVRTPDGRQKRYKVGDTIVDGVVLYRVEDERLLIRRAGVIEAIPFRSEATTLVSSANRAPIPRRLGSGAVQSANGTEPVAPVAASTPSVPQVDVAALFEGLSPRVSADGAAIEIYPRGDDRVFLAAGFERGDVLRSINGQTVVPGTDLARLFSNMSRATSVTAVVSRAGAERAIKFDVEQK